MRMRRSKFLRDIEEPIVVLRGVPGVFVNPDASGTWNYGDGEFDKRVFSQVVPDSPERKACILPNRGVVDSSGFAVSQVDYLANIIPPIAGLAVGDIVIRTTAADQELYIERITEVAGVQQLELVNRAKARTTAE